MDYNILRRAIKGSLRIATPSKKVKTIKEQQEEINICLKCENTKCNGYCEKFKKN